MRSSISETPPAPAPVLTPALRASPLREAVTALTRRPEPELLPGLLEQARLGDPAATRAGALALRIARGVRERSSAGGRAGLVQGLLQEFALSSHEGVALMCLAEALLRIPDAGTRDVLIRDKISHGNWQQHLGRSPSLFVNAATWGLLLTGRLVATHSDEGLNAALRHIVGRGGEPLIRKSVDMAMRMMGEQFVTGETIEQALDNAGKREAQGFRFSYDMLGEAALTAHDADRYFVAYEQAIDAIGAASGGRGIYEGPGISVKLSALHPRYARAKLERVMTELYPRLVQLARLARRCDIGMNIDAEEADRLELSLDLLERLCLDPALIGWNGIGFVIQAYQKRCPAVVDFLVDLARRSKRRLMVRLVKGAYWDSEIKRAQIDGLDGYPVYTRKAHTDVAFVACARKLLAVPDAIYPQFATHNAHTLAAVHELAGANFYAGQYEFQCLHGMGEPLYEQVVGSASDGRLGRPCRIYAPVGSHDTLLAYLVRRLLENGANTSFVNRIADDDVPLEVLVEDPVRTVQAQAVADGVVGAPHPAIALPKALFGSRRHNSTGLDLANEPQLTRLGDALAAVAGTPWQAAPLLATDVPPGATQPVLNPADPGDVVGQVQEATAADVETALAAALTAAPGWAATPPSQRATLLEGAANRLQADIEPLCTLLVREAGKTFANAVAEVREAVDFLRYYGAEVRRDFHNTTHLPLGPVLCISPWNFPLAIFTGQVAAALAAGNSVLAKPAEQTPLVAAAAVRALHAAGVPRAALQLLPGRGETVGAALVADARIQGVLFTGSTEVARLLQRTLANRLGPQGRPVPLIAETGGQNAMIVDSSALTEQVVQDVLGSAFDSAGQRCSALRVLCVQRDAADRVVEMLIGAMREQQIGDPRMLAVDVGPVIDAEARGGIERHIAAMRAKGRRIIQPLSGDANVHAPGSVGTVAAAQNDGLRGNFVAPTLIEIDSLDELEREVFGPVLHVLRYGREQLPALLAQINATGYGLTCGVHTRIDETVVQVAQTVHAGNFYVNRNVVGAVVGVQPFGGEGLSGTGPKAGGPLYLLRLLATHPADAARRAVDSAGADASAPVRGLDVDSRRLQADQALLALRGWAQERGDAALATSCERFAACSPAGRWRALPGPTGEANLYAVLPRHRVLCLAETDADRLTQLAAVLAVGSSAMWPADAGALRERLPDHARERVALAQDWTGASVHFDAMLHSGSIDSLRATADALAERPGPIVGVTHCAPGNEEIGLERLVIERSLSVNTAAAGGNASLMAIG
ncbi:MAG: trifunctional transcriptional regulator/proline dehydrogenase/L-glutamate gamma-semialdehyde dehydrogenase [Rhizobacter sp.]|nr:trifunctional transcriptional regulator/proline dehydrogenase/L-glutamate gamma-semialdehyde dehydrogenase [Rhizobacter sp.]